MPKLLKSTDRWAEKHFDEVVEFLWANKRKIYDEAAFPNGFEYPDYGGMPKKLSSHLSSDFVDAIQEALFYWDEANCEGRKMTKDTFARICGKYLYAE